MTLFEPEGRQPVTLMNRDVGAGRLSRRLMTVVIAIALAASMPANAGVTIFSDGFQNGAGFWTADNGLWEVGVNASCRSGGQCAATRFNGGYANGANTRFISPPVSLPSVTAGDQILLKFWQWFSIEDGYDQGVLQISVDGGAWQTLSGEFDGSSVVWTQYVQNLTAFAGSSVRFAFYFTSDGTNTAAGWWIDDVSIEVTTFGLSNPEGFEGGVGDWSADNGLWEVGTNDFCHSGNQCAATVLGGNYANGANTRFISPPVSLPSVTAGGSILLKFSHWFSIENGYDGGFVQISTNGGPWQTVSGKFTGASGVWTQYVLDLSAFAGSSVRLAFYFTSDGTNTAAGWWIDEIGFFLCSGGANCVPLDGGAPTTTTTSSTTTSSTTTSTSTSSTPTSLPSTTTSSSTPSTSPTTTLPTTTVTTTSTTSTTLRECNTVRCLVDGARRGDECADEALPPAVARQLDAAIQRAELAPDATPHKAQRLRRAARRLLNRAAKAVNKAAKGRRATLSKGCARSLKDAITQAVLGLT